MSVLSRIEDYVNDHEVVLFMKGTQEFPQCGFSGKVVRILKLLDVDFFAINVLEDDEVREGVKVFSNWPTIPQLYVKGELVGGCDIVLDLYESGELAKILAPVEQD
jgi:monothiol glutaredoxin